MSKKKTAIISTAAGILLLAIGVALGYVLFGNKADANGDTGLSDVSATVCDSDIVSLYNQAARYEIRGNADQPTIDETGLKTLSDEIVGKDGYQEDPTCQTILFWTAVNAKNYDAAKTAYEAIKALHADGRFANTNLRTTTALFEYESVLDTVSPDYGSREESAGGL